MEKRNLLVDTNMFEKNTNNLFESRIGSNGKMYVTGIIHKADAINGNGREYPFTILQNEVQNYIKNYINENKALGELDHPDSSQINLKNVSHIIREVDWRGKDLYGVVEILETESGNTLRKLFEAGVKIGISSRGFGSLIPRSGVYEVQDDYELLCFDFVSTPSTPGAYLGIIKESMESSIDNNTEFNILMVEIRNDFSEIRESLNLKK